MSSALDKKPAKDTIDTGVTDPSTVAVGLAEVLADSYRLMIKTHVVHWNVEGPMFYAVHNLTEAQYEELFTAVDEIAERIRALGELTAMSSNNLLSGSVIKDVTAPQTAGEMCQDLADDHATLAKRLHLLIETADEANDPVSEDLATTRAAVHEKAAWMLRAISKA